MPRLRIRLPAALPFALLAPVLAGGCAGKASPGIAYDPAQMIEAAPIDAPLPALPARDPAPPPAPEHTREISTGPGRAGVPGSLSPLDQALAWREAARLEPPSGKSIQAITVYPFLEGGLYRVYTAPEQVTDLALQPGETLRAVAAGDTVRWVVGDTTSGSGASEQVHVLIKPFAAELTTNLVILTDRRTYHLELESVEEPAMSAVSWSYPAEELLALSKAQDALAAAAPVASGLAPDALRFRYRIEGDDPPWRPRQVFDDGRKVYIAFPERIDQGEAPPLFLLGADGKAELINYRMRRNYYIVDRLFAAAELRLGEAPQQVVRILRSDVGSGGDPENPMPGSPIAAPRRDR